uniref:Uncharacterized protein n=1 Tax=Onchocerca volvulus TaxID=6282 RepID=A0A8R1TXQ7_ONCVO
MLDDEEDKHGDDNEVSNENGNDDDDDNNKWCTREGWVHQKCKGDEVNWHLRSITVHCGNILMQKVLLIN